MLRFAKIDFKNFHLKLVASKRQKFKSAGILQRTNCPVDSTCSLSYRELPSNMAPTNPTLLKPKSYSGIFLPFM